MLFSVALILLAGLSMGWICQKMKLPSLIGMLITGVVLGPFVLNLLDPKILGISAELRKIALIIILTRAGLGLDLSALKKNGRPALLLCFVPATCELLGILVLGPMLFGMSILEAAILGAVLAAVSPAVVVPRMVRLMEEGLGTKKGIPQMILAGASVDDVYVIVLFTTFLGMAQGEGVSVLRFVNIPVSILLGIVIGLLIGWVFSQIFRRIHMREIAQMLIVLGISLLLVVGEDRLTTPITYASLIAVMFIGVSLRKRASDTATRLSGLYGKVWIGAEVFLFVLVGASVNIHVLGSAGLRAIGLVFLALVVRMLGVCLCVLFTSLGWRERLFVMIAYTPKATVQAAIGGIPLALGLPCGDLVLTIAVLAIVITAPLGAFAMDRSDRYLLQSSKESAKG